MNKTIVFPIAKQTNQTNQNQTNQNQTKTIDNNHNTQNNQNQPTKSNRVITQTKKWDKFFAEYQTLQCSTILQLFDDPETEMCGYILQQIQKKICGYKSQDVDKGLYSETEFVKKENVVELLKKCEMLCFYCREPVQLLYESVREPKQWTLDRIDNDYGHNANNLEIACLSCNLRRRTMYHERYAFTKQLVITKVL